MVPGFRTTTWDPTLIIGQILCIQSAFYSAQGVLMLLWCSLSAYKPSVDHMLSQQTMRPMTVIQLLATPVTAYVISMVVGRARQCLDFTWECTLHFIHLLLVFIYNAAVPTQLTWWLVQLVSVSICALISEYLCMQKETLEIPLRLPPSSTRVGRGERSEDTELLLVNCSAGDFGNENGQVRSP